MSPVLVLVEEWRKEAAELRERYGLMELARVTEAHANDLEKALANDAVSLLTLDEASAYCGYCKAHLRALMADGKLTNGGRKGSPRFYKGELTIKPGHVPVEPSPHYTAGRMRRPRV